jgi:hypothetical protein
MAVPWSAPIKAAGQLSIFPTANVTKGPWAATFTNAIAAFNALSAQHKLKVTLTVVTQPPDPSGVGGADVQFDTLAGKATVTSFNQQFSHSMTGTELKGFTLQIKEQFTSATKTVTTMAKAFVWVPATPIAEKDFVTKKPRIADDSAKLVIAVHELIHVAGLDNAEHTDLTKGDLFSSPLLIQTRSKPPNGPRPDDTMVPFGATAPVMPPLVLTAPTISLIQSVW